MAGASNTSPSSPLVLPGIPAGHVSWFSPPSLYSSRSDRNNDLSSRREIYIISFPRDRGRIQPLVSSPSYRNFFRIFSLAILTFAIQIISVNHFISCSYNIKWCMSESTLIVYCNFILRKNTDIYEFINCA